MKSLLVLQFCQIQKLNDQSALLKGVAEAGHEYDQDTTSKIEKLESEVKKLQKQVRKLERHNKELTAQYTVRYATVESSTTSRDFSQDSEQNERELRAENVELNAAKVCILSVRI